MRNDPQSGRGQGHVTYFLNFGNSDSITFKRMKLDSSFFLCWIGHGKYYIRDDEWPKGGVAKVTCPTFEAMGQIPVFHRTYFLLIQQTVQGVIVQYRLALYSIPIGLLNTIQACKVVELFLLATIGLSHCFGGTLFFGWLKCQFLNDVEELVHDRRELCRLPVGTR